MGGILIVDGDRRLQLKLRGALEERGHTVWSAFSGEEGLAAVSRSVPDLILLEASLPGMDGLEVYGAIRDLDPKLPAIIMAAFCSTDTAIKATRMGAFDYVLKPFGLPELLHQVDEALEAGRFMHSRGRRPGFDLPASTIIGQSPAMLEVYKTIGRVASSNVTVLVRGESGTGKELVARAIHHHGLRSSRDFQVINCVAIPENLLESELFGYEEGAFTGAVHRRCGMIEKAAGGTVFLDEIGDMPLNIQAKILRLLQEKTFQRLGSEASLRADVRIIAATNRNLEEALDDHRFREDLYYRLKVVTLRVPPLRERREDIPLLCDYLLECYSREAGNENPGMAVEAKDVLRLHDWPGNVRELANTLQKVLLFNRGARITADDVTRALRDDDMEPRQELRADAGDWIRDVLLSDNTDARYAYCMERFSRRLIRETLEFTGGNRTQAARLLGISRQTLQAKVARLKGDE